VFALESPGISAARAAPVDEFVVVMVVMASLTALAAAAMVNYARVSRSSAICRNRRNLLCFVTIHLMSRCSIRSSSIALTVA
jgi:hypothetical protein